MKKKIFTITFILLSIIMASFALVPILTESVSGTERYRHSINHTFDIASNSTPSTLYYGLSTSTITPAATELKIAANPNFTSQGNVAVSSSDTFKSLHANGLSPDSNYTLYSILVSDLGEESEVFSKEIAPINYITNAVYNANKVSTDGAYNSNNDDTITITFNEPFIYNPENSNIYFEIHVGYLGSTDYNELATNPPSQSELYPIAHLSNYSFSKIVNIDSHTIELTINSSSLEEYNTESKWLVNNPTFAQIMVMDEINHDTFGMDGGLYFMPMTYEIITTETYPELNAFSYENSKGFSSDYMTLEFNKSVSDYITNDDIIISFDDKTNGVYSNADITLNSDDFILSNTQTNSIKINFTLSGQNKIKLLESNSIAKVQINNNSTGLTMSPTKNSKKLNMPGQNSSLATLNFKNDAINNFSSSKYSYYIDLNSEDYDETIASSLDLLTATSVDQNANITVSTPTRGVYNVSVVSNDTNEISTYIINLRKIETRFSHIYINEALVSNFSPDIYDYTFNVDSSFKVTSFTADLMGELTNYSTVYTGTQPGVYTITAKIEAPQHIGISSVYTFKYISPIPDAPSSNSSSKTTTISDPVEASPSTKQLTTNLSANVDNILKDEEELDDPKTIEKISNTLENLTSSVDTQAETLQATEDLLKLTDTLSKSTLESDINTDKFVNVLNEISKSMAELIAKFDNSKDKLNKIDEFTKSLTQVKDSDIDTSELDKSINNIISDTSRSLNTIKITKSLATADNKKTFTITEDIISSAAEGSDDKIDELSKMADNYFKNENYIDLKKEVLLLIESSDDLTNIAIDNSAIKKINEANVKNINISVDYTTVSLPTELLDSKDNYQLVVKKLTPSSQLKRDEEVKTNVATLTNNKKYVDVSLYKNGNELADLDKPVELRLDTKHFGIEEIDSRKETLTILRYNDESGIWEPVGGIYDPLTNSISVHRIHLSKYTVMKTKKTITDVENEEVTSEVLNLLNKGIIDDEKANMKDNITREEFVTWLGKSYGLTSLKAITPFEDLDPESESYKFVASVYEQGIISGKSKDKFGSNDFMTYEEVAVVLSNTLTTLDNKKINNNLTKKLGQLGEEVNVSEWAEDEIALIIELGIMDDSVALNANGYISREEAAAIFDKFYS